MNAFHVGRVRDVSMGVVFMLRLSKIDLDSLSTISYI